MKKFFLFFLAGLLSIYGQGQNEEDERPTVTTSDPSVIIQYIPGSVQGNEQLVKIVKNYFRSDPYQNEFGFFVKHLMNDPILIDKTTRLKTDTSLFYFQGVYKGFSPFGFLSDRTEVRLAETEFVINDSTSLKDTLMVYQVLGFCYNGKAGRQAVKEEFTKFNRRYSNHFMTQASNIMKDDEIIGATKNYFVSGVAISPLTVSWAKFDDFQNAFIITLRIKIK